MSVIVKGICKPIDCDSTYYRCPFLDDTDDCKLQDCDPDWSWEEQYKGCPLIEIPEGERLIDARKLKNKVLKWMPPDPCGVEGREYPFETDICVSMLMEIDDAPTIFEEEEE